MARMDESMGVEWTPTLVVRLVQEYERRRELWDVGHDLYRVHTAKHELWEELAAIFDCEVPDLKKKLNSILASHRREKAKVRAGARTSWFLYHHLRFLPTHVSAPDAPHHVSRSTLAPISQAVRLLRLLRPYSEWDAV